MSWIRRVISNPFGDVGGSIPPTDLSLTKTLWCKGQPRIIMAVINFKDKLAKMKLTEFEFESFEITMASVKEDEERQKILIFELVNPIEKVTSSLLKSNPDDWQEKRHPFKTDVVEVRCNADIIDKYSNEWTFEEDNDGKFTGKGSYGGDLFLDLSSKGEVWVVDKKLSKYGQEMRQKDKKVAWDRWFSDPKEAK